MPRADPALKLFALVTPRVRPVQAMLCLNVRDMVLCPIRSQLKYTGNILAVNCSRQHTRPATHKESGCNCRLKYRIDSTRSLYLNILSLWWTESGTKHSARCGCQSFQHQQTKQDLTSMEE